MTRTAIIQHYKSFFDLEEMAIAEDDQLHIDWAEALLEDMKKPNIEHTLNRCLNDALCTSKRIKGTPNSNKVAEFVNEWMEENRTH